MAALGGVIACQILEGEYGVAKEQLDFLKEIQSTMTAQQTTSGGNNFSKSEILYMSALMGRLTGAPSDQVGISMQLSWKNSHYEFEAYEIEGSVFWGSGRGRITVCQYERNF